jgi:hypothetical protein
LQRQNTCAENTAPQVCKQFKLLKFKYENKKHSVRLQHSHRLSPYRLGRKKKKKKKKKKGAIRKIVATAPKPHTTAASRAAFQHGRMIL